MEHEDFENINLEIAPGNEEEINILKDDHEINVPPHEPK